MSRPILYERNTKATVDAFQGKEFGVVFLSPYVKLVVASPTLNSRDRIDTASLPGAIIRNSTFSFNSFGYLTLSSSSPLRFKPEV